MITLIKKRIERTGTPIFISRAVERGAPVPLSSDVTRIFEEPTSPECYANAHPDRVSGPPAQRIVVDPDDVDQPQDDSWRHELDHDVESVFWLPLHWGIVTQPKGGQREDIDSGSWSSLLGDIKGRERLVSAICSGDSPTNLTHSVYAPLWPLIQYLAEILEVDKQRVPTDDVRRCTEYICEAFQRLILHFIISNRDESFMTCPVDNFLRQVQPVARSGAPATSPSERRDESDRANRRRLQDEGEDESSQIVQ